MKHLLVAKGTGELRMLQLATKNRNWKKKTNNSRINYMK